MPPPGFTMIDNDAVIGRLPEIDGTAIKVLLALARRANTAGRCWPSQDTIASDTGLRPRAVRSALRPPAVPLPHRDGEPIRSRHNLPYDPGTAVPP